MPELPGSRVMMVGPGASARDSSRRRRTPTRIGDREPGPRPRVDCLDRELAVQRFAERVGYGARREPTLDTGLCRGCVVGAGSRRPDCRTSGPGHHADARGKGRAGAWRRRTVGAVTRLRAADDARSADAGTSRSAKWREGYLRPISASAACPGRKRQRPPGWKSTACLCKRSRSRGAAEHTRRRHGGRPVVRRRHSLWRTRSEHACCARQCR